MAGEVEKAQVYVVLSLLWFSIHAIPKLYQLECVGDMFTEEQNELVESAAEMLYGLIHVRYILTTKGMAAMVRICIVYLN